MRRSLIFLACLLLGTAASAQSLLGNIDQDVFKGLLLMAMPDKSPVISAAVPEELASLRMPAGFGWIGSLERRMDVVMGAGTTQTMAAWRTSLAADAAQAQAVGAMTAQGWTVAQGMGASLGMNVFVGANPSISQTVCRGAQPHAVSAGTIDGVTYVLVAATRGNQNSICNAQMRPVMSLGMDTSLDPWLPKLQLPVDPSTGRQVNALGGGGGGLGSGRQFRTAIETTATAAAVATHFADQMAAQGWTRDAAWSGESTAGSAWVRRPDPGTTILASLQVTAMGDSQVRAVLYMVKAK